jgi:hypothetical protein
VAMPVCLLLLLLLVCQLWRLGVVEQFVLES